MAWRASGVRADSRPDKGKVSGTIPETREPEPEAVPTALPFEGFRFIQTLAAQKSGRAASHESVGAFGVASLLGSAAATATLTAWLRSRTKPERDLPKGTHVNAAVTAFKALGVATTFTGVATSVVFLGAWVIGIDSAETLRRSLRGATRASIAATSRAEGIRSSGTQ